MAQHKADEGYLRVVLQAVQGPRCISLVGCLVLAVPSFAGTAMAELLRQSSIAGALAIAGLLTLADVVILVAADRTVLRNRKTRPVPLAVVLAVYLCVTLVRPILATLFGTALGITPVGVARYAGSIAVGIVALALVATVLDQSDRYRQRMSQLQSEQDRLAALQLQFAAELEGHRSALLQNVDANIGRALEGVRQELGSALPDPIPDQLQAAARDIRSVAQDTVRPMSHNLRNLTPRLHEPTAHPATLRELFSINRKKVISDTFLVRPYAPVVVPALDFIVGSPYVLASEPGFTGLVSLLLECVILGCVLWLAGRLFPRSRLAKLSTPARVATFLATYLIGITLAAAATFALWPSHRLSTAVAGYIAVLLLALAVALAASLAENGAIAGRSLAAAVSAQKWEVHREELELQQVTRQAATTLHGNVQSRLSVLAFTLDAMAARPDGTGPMREEAVQSAVDEVTDIIAGLPKTTTVPELRSLSEAMAQVCAAWDGLVEVSLDADPDAVDVASSNGYATLILEMTREAITNAVRHGGATRVQISLVAGGSLLEFTATDNGSGMSQTHGIGMGLGQLTDSGVEWSVAEQPGGGTVLSAKFPARQAEYGV